MQIDHMIYGRKSNFWIMEPRWDTLSLVLKKQLNFLKELQDSHGYEQKLLYIENKLRPFFSQKN